MKSEKWDGMDGYVVHDKEKGVIVRDNKLDNANDIIDQKGVPVDEARRKLFKNTLKKNIKIEPVQLAGYFESKYDPENAKKVAKLDSDSATKQFKQIKNEMQFFGESFLEGFLGFYGIKLDNALERYEHNYHVLEVDDISNPKQTDYYIAMPKQGNIDDKKIEVPNREIAELNIAKFYGEQSVKLQQENTQSLSIKKEEAE
ncbi:hypothetical protein [Weissella confusa]